MAPVVGKACNNPLGYARAHVLPQKAGRQPYIPPGDLQEDPDLDLDEICYEAKKTESTASTTSVYTLGKLRFNISPTSSPRSSTYETLRVSDLAGHYVVGNKIGSGAYGSVYRAKCKKSGKTFAIKSVKVTGKTVEPEAEIAHLCEIDHPYIVKLHHFIRDADEYHLVMDLCLGGTLSSLLIGHVISCRQVFPSYNSGLHKKMAQRFLWQMLSGLAFLHHHGFIHRDIKMDNYLVEEGDSETSYNLKLGDFGLAHRMAKGEYLTRQVGTPFYAAPEVYNGKYTHNADIWSLGVAAHNMCTSYLPFPASTVDEYLTFAEASNFTDTGSAWKMQTEKTRDLVYSMLVADPAQRPSAKQLLADNVWLRAFGAAAGQAGCCTVS